MLNIFIKYQLNKLTKTFAREKSFREYKDIHKVMLLFDIEDLAQVMPLVDSMLAEGKHVTAYSFELKKTLHPQLSENIKILGNEHLDFWGVPKTDVLSAFKKHTADTLMDLTGKSSLVLQYLFLNFRADFSVGFNRGNLPFYDMLIERNEEHDFSFFADQLLFYMKSLHSK